MLFYPQSLHSSVFFLFEFPPYDAHGHSGWFVGLCDRFSTQELDSVILMGLFQLEMFYDCMTNIPLVFALDPRALIRQSKSEAANPQVRYTIPVPPHKINHSSNSLSEFNLCLNFILLWVPGCKELYTRKCYLKVTQYWTWLGNLCLCGTQEQIRSNQEYFWHHWYMRVEEPSWILCLLDFLLVDSLRVSPQE